MPQKIFIDTIKIKDLKLLPGKKCLIVKHVRHHCHLTPPGVRYCGAKSDVYLTEFKNITITRHSPSAIALSVLYRWKVLHSMRSPASLLNDVRNAWGFSLILKSSMRSLMHQ